MGGAFKKRVELLVLQFDRLIEAEQGWEGEVFDVSGYATLVRRGEAEEEFVVGFAVVYDNGMVKEPFAFA